MDIFNEINTRQKAGQPFVIATIIRTAGASPRAVGARMLVFPDGTIFGTIGGGSFEKLVIDDCLRLMKSDTHHLLKKYRFSPAGEDATGMACGGEAEVFMEIGGRPKRLIIFGGGHIARELVRLASGSAFSITVIDDREEILSQYKEPVSTVLTNNSYSEQFPALDKDSYIVIVTRSHKFDQPILARVINEDCAYIGMIGSKAKVAGVYASLEETGIDRNSLERVHAPIGLDIKAEGPYEIAVAILAELIATKNRAADRSV
ncbi:MAG: XdhC family protein [Candidatus Zixiibacteriota bacterium]|nr:MAG: XdhC family protein [candidate division Zixibacteria bacterium]